MTQQFKALKEQVKENKQKLDKLIAFRVPYVIEESVTTHVIYEVKNQVPTLVPDVVANFIQLREKNQKKHKLDGESYASKEQVTFELANYEAQPSSTDKSRRHEEWFTKDAYTYYYWVDKETNVHEEAISRLFRSSVTDYDDDTELGIHHWPNLQKGFYKMRRASLTKYGVHSNYMIVTVKHVEVERQFDYGFLSSVKSDGKEYTFKESDYYRLNLNDIKDMYVLKAQGKLHHLGGQAKYDLTNSLQIYIRKEVIKKRVDDV
ncbi:hypothetical protein Tco_1421703 [Tanacetum coccineum]